MNRLGAKAAGYETLYVHFDEDSQPAQAARLLAGASPSSSDQQISDQWLSAYGNPAQNEWSYPYQDRDGYSVRMFGA